MRSYKKEAFYERRSIGMHCMNEMTIMCIGLHEVMIRDVIRKATVNTIIKQTLICYKARVHSNTNSAYDVCDTIVYVAMATVM